MSASVDAIIAFDVQEHFTRDEAIQLLDEVFRVLNADGRFIAHSPNAETPLFGRTRYGDLTHEMAYTRTPLTQLLHHGQ
jgi:predicted SAM-dependent methyltransferase